MITFTRRTRTYDEATGRVTTVETTITGSAIQVRGNPERYKALGLELTSMPTLLFTPDTYGLPANSAQFVQPGDVTVWAGTSFTVKDVDAIAPDGVVIMGRIVVGA